MLQALGRAVGRSSNGCASLRGRLSSSAASGNPDEGPWTWPWSEPLETDQGGMGQTNDGELPVMVGPGYEQLRTNWSGNVRLRGEGDDGTGAVPLTSPADITELQDVVAGAEEIAIVGSGHSFNDCAAMRPWPGSAKPPAEGSRALISTAFLSIIEEIDANAMTVRCGGGTTISQLCRYLHPRGAALPQVASLPHVTIAGAMATATHGSGNAEQALPAALRSMDLMTADGSIRTLHRDTDEFRAAAVSFGTFGIITAVDLDIIPAFDVHQSTYKDVLLDNMFSLADVMSLADGVSALVDFGEPNPHAAFLSFRNRLNQPPPPLVLPCARPSNLISTSHPFLLIGGCAVNTCVA
mmetsp:Transcript_66/g.203  ORF Transcript_66/g.203 Transcript_66/m.203 type:complete len:353 (+) Transcript_66:212-1270(+)